MQYREFWLLWSNFIFSVLPISRNTQQRSLWLSFPWEKHFLFVFHLLHWISLSLDDEKSNSTPQITFSRFFSLYCCYHILLIHLSLQWMNLFSCESIMLSLRVQAFPLLQVGTVPSLAAMLHLLRITHIPLWLSQGTRWGCHEHLPSLPSSPGASLNVDFHKKNADFPDSVVNTSGESPVDLVAKFQLCAGRLTPGEWEGAAAAP